MKYIITVLFGLIPLLSNSQTTQNQNVNRDLHFSFATTGGDLTGEEGSISYSIGQMNYLPYNENSNYAAEGVQQPLIISLRSINIKEEEKEIFTIAAYPNPVTDYFLIEASDYTYRSLKYHLTDLNGNFIKEGKIEESGAKVDISGLAVAMYLLHITDYTQHIKTFRIIKK